MTSIKSKFSVRCIKSYFYQNILVKLFKGTQTKTSCGPVTKGMMNVILRVLVVMLILFLLSTACQLNIEDERNYSNPSIQNSDNNHNDVRDIPNVREMSSEVKNAKDLVRLAESVQGVDAATAVVSEIYAVVGITFEKDLQTKQKGEIKQRVFDSLSDHPHGANAVVTTKPEHINALKEMGNNIELGNLEGGIYLKLTQIMSESESNEQNPTGESRPTPQEIKEEKVRDNQQ
jgi:YhcN/YlaJ family sporulation lipoprotein